MDIFKLCQLGEGKTLEYKINTDSLFSILKSVIAFANTAGGIILFGVADDGTIVGIKNPDKVQEQLANSIANRVRPHIIPDLTVTKVENKSVIVLQIEHSSGPYYLADKGPEKSIYIRLGNSNHLAGPEIIDELKRVGNYASYDKMPCDDVTESDLDINRIQSIYGKRGKSLDTQKLISIGILTKKGRHIVATNGGVILFGLPEMREAHFPYAEVRCARFAGTSRSEFIDRLNIEGGILSAIDEVPKFLRRNTKMAGKFGAMHRRDIPEYPIDGVREALVNAMVHANYEISGSRIFIAIYDDRLEIQNPGIMLPGMSIEQFKAGVSRIRNPVIAKIFNELQLLEEWGSGYKRIKNACENEGYPMPKWEEFGTALRVTFYPHPEVVEQSHLGVEVGTKLAPGWHQAGTRLAPSYDTQNTGTEIDEEMLKLAVFCRKPRMLQEMLQYMDWRDKTKFRRRFLFPLIKKGIIERTIPDKPSSPKQRYITNSFGIELLKKLKDKRD